MKIITLLTVLFFSILQSAAQCTENVSSFGNNNSIPEYNINGDVNLTLDQNGTSLTLDLGSNFMTAAGPDIRAFLVNPNGLSDAQLTTTSITSTAIDSIEFGLVGSSSQNQNGAKSFTIEIPDNIVLGDYNKLFFYCLEFDQFWDFGTFESFTEDSCSALSLQNNTLATQVTLYPNPTREILNTTGISTAAEIKIFDILGKEVLKSTTTSEKSIDVSILNSGIYLVSITVNEQQITQKLIIQ